MSMRGPALRLHCRGIDVGRWFRGERFREFESTLRWEFVASLIAIVWPCSLTFAAATGLTACHQIITLEHWGTSHSYWLVLECNVSLATAASASFAAYKAGCQPDFAVPL